MRRDVSLEEISDGKLYGANDMVKADCQDCTGCSDCCQGMGDTLVLDPLDVYRLGCGLGKNCEELAAICMDFDVADGNILPHLRMTGRDEQCVFLNKEGRCSIHPIRPGFWQAVSSGTILPGWWFSVFSSDS